jgi:5-methylcytosine-specific restriction endonuclease McrA
VVKKSESDESPYGPPKPAHAAHAAQPAHPSRPRKRGGRKKSASKSGTPRAHRELTSQPTTRNAIVATRAWLLKHYGPHCAYCGLKFEPRVITLDHVAPRRGQTAYDRRDNLVLACRPCNALKRDMAPLAFLLAKRSRVGSLLKYGAHLSTGLLDLARPLLRPDADAASSNGKDASRSAEPKTPRVRYGTSDDDGPSPYSD